MARTKTPLTPRDKPVTSLMSSMHTVVLRATAKGITGASDVAAKLRRRFADEWNVRDRQRVMMIGGGGEHEDHDGTWSCIIEARLPVIKPHEDFEEKLDALVGTIVGHLLRSGAGSTAVKLLEHDARLLHRALPPPPPPPPSCNNPKPSKKQSKERSGGGAVAAAAAPADA